MTEFEHAAQFLAVRKSHEFKKIDISNMLELENIELTEIKHASPIVCTHKNGGALQIGVHYKLLD